MKQFLIVGDHADGSGEFFKCDWFVEAETPGEAWLAWLAYLEKEWDIDVSEIDKPRIFEVPTISTPAGQVRVLDWHSEVPERFP